MSGTAGPAAHEMMPVIHRIFRRQFGEMRALVREVPAGDTARVRAVADHVEFLLDGLHMHHTTEDDLIWPKLLDRVGLDAPLVERMEVQHQQVDGSMTEVRAALPPIHHSGPRCVAARDEPGRAMTVAAAACSIVLGLGFGLPGGYGAWHCARHGEVWTFLGFPTYGGGAFERWGWPTGVALLLAFVAVCVAEVVIGLLIWGDVAAAPWLALALLPIELVFWIGFALPFGPPLGLARTALVIAVLASDG
jgi:hypothetical protein